MAVFQAILAAITNLPGLIDRITKFVSWVQQLIAEFRDNELKKKIDNAQAVADKSLDQRGLEDVFRGK